MMKNSSRVLESQGVDQNSALLSSRTIDSSTVLSCIGSSPKGPFIFVSNPIYSLFSLFQNRFFLGWAQCWRQNITKERALQLLTLDPHGPNPMRCNGPLSNMFEFHEAFDVSEDSPMYKEKTTRVDIW